MEPNVIYILDDEDGESLRENLSDWVKEKNLPFSVESFKYDKTKPPSDQLKEAVEQILARTNIAVVLLDYYFKSANIKEIADPYLIDLRAAGIPVIVLTGATDLRVGRRAGLYDAYVESKPFTPDTLDLVKQVINEEQRRPSFYRQTLIAEEQFADSYDQVELRYPGTVAMMLWENDYALQQLKEKQAKLGYPIDILDIGCGTGRFEELIISDPELAQNISEFHAVDFSPAVLELAKQRLGIIMASGRLSYSHPEVLFRRRIAENLLILDDNLEHKLFDAILVCFGVLSFTQYSRTLNEVYSALKPGGIAIFTVYNRDSVYYDYFRSTDDPGNRPLITDIDRERSIMRLKDKNNKAIEKRCLCFSVDALKDTLKGFGFDILNIETFPFLSTFISPPALSHVSLQTQTVNTTRLSYTSDFLLTDQMNSGFSKSLYDVDVRVSAIMKNKGHYITATVTKA